MDQELVYYNRVNDKAVQIVNELKELKTKGEITKKLLEFKVLTREKCLNQHVWCESTIKLLLDLTIQGQVEAQKCLSNLILNYSNIREQLAETYIDYVRNRIISFMDQADAKKNEENMTQSEASSSITNLEDELSKFEQLYYDLRILFLLSAICSRSRPAIRGKTFDLLLKLLDLLADDLVNENICIIIESLKNVFNLTMVDDPNNALAIDVIIKLFSSIRRKNQFVNSLNNADKDYTQRKRELADTNNHVLVNLIHLLTNMPVEIYERLSVDHANNVLEALETHLGRRNADFFDTILPILNACTNICKHNESIRLEWFNSHLYSITDFQKRPEEYDNLRGKLVKLMTSSDLRIKEMVAEFLYSLCGKDKEKLVTFTGFGNAAAFLTNRGLLGQSKRNNNETAQDEDLEEPKYKFLRDHIDPMTGRLEEPKDVPEMTQEQKEYYADQLANAITKLTSLGIVTPMKPDGDGKLINFRPRGLDEDGG